MLPKPIKTTRNVMLIACLAVYGLASADSCRPTVGGNDPNLKFIGGEIPITGHAPADARIRELAEQRGYRPQTMLADRDELAFPWSIHRCVVPHWIRLAKAAAEQGFGLNIVSGFRSVERQRQIFLSHHYLQIKQ